MSSAKKIVLAVSVLSLLLISAGATAAIGENINWVSKQCFTVGPVKMCKPSKNWDTQKTKDYNAKYKFVLHRGGANPVCWLRFDESPKGKTAHSYANWLKGRYKQRGLSNLTIRKEVIAGRNVSFVSGTDMSKGFRYLVGVWRNRNAGVNLECTAQAKDFATYAPQFRNFIGSARFISETSH